MRREHRGGRRRRAVAAAALALAVWLAPGAWAHKPITSPYTFYEDVLPITQARCGGCHAPDGIAPMSLLTHEATVPWGESIRLELVAGHMPPGSVSSPPARVHQTSRLTARELNVLLTWATGGTPPGDSTKAATPAPTAPAWTLGPPTETVPLPRVELGSDVTTRVVESVVPLGPRARTLAALDLRPGTRSVVRSARMFVRERAAAGPVTERLVGLWVPGEEASRPPDRAGWRVGPGAELVVRTLYRKRWDREREPASDESVLALYDADEPQGPALDTIEVSGTGAVTTDRRVVAAVAIARPARLLAFWPDTALAGAAVVVDLVQANGTRDPLAAFDARAGWERRYRLVRPEPLAAGARIEVTAQWSPPAQAPPVSARLIGFDVVAE